MEKEGAGSLSCEYEEWYSTEKSQLWIVWKSFGQYEAVQWFSQTKCNDEMIETWRCSLARRAVLISCSLKANAIESAQEAAIQCPELTVCQNKVAFILETLLEFSKLPVSAAPFPISILPRTIKTPPSLCTVLCKQHRWQGWMTTCERKESSK